MKPVFLLNCSSREASCTNKRYNERQDLGWKGVKRTPFAISKVFVNTILGFGVESSGLHDDDFNDRSRIVSGREK
jgi:hypothetical protein